MKNWYLLTSETPPNSIGGYENESFSDYKLDAFLEALQTDIATTVVLYNHDRTESKEIRCIIQDNTSNTQLKSMERSVLAPLGTLKAGMYILFEDVYWLVSGYPGNNGIYEKATLALCQYILKWQDNAGKIIERPSNFTSASKYDTGSNGNQNIILASNNFTIWVPDDDESATLDGKRLFIDRNLINPKKVYEITRSDDVLYLFGKKHGGILSFIADKTELDLSVDRPDLGICNYIEPLAHISSQAIITGGNELRCGSAKTWTVAFKDKEGNGVDSVDYEWSVVGNFTVSQTIKENQIQLKVDDDSLIGESFLLQVTSSDTIVAENKIEIIEAF